ncbi:MAG: hypothetical protein LBL70_04570 [Treponema sp.]|nr:hypothetical protein [Treponema sp.]
MKHKPAALGLALILLSLAPLLPAAEDNIIFSIRYFDKRIYHAPGTGTEPIYVQATVTNNSPYPFRFKLADDRAFSVEFDVRTMKNRNVEPADSLVRKRSGSERVFFREISVESGESFSFVEDLRDYTKFGEPGSFIVLARIYPELLRPELLRSEFTAGASIAERSAGTSLESNRLTLNIRPAPIPGPQGIPLAMDIDTGEVLARERLAPDEVVDYLIGARQKSQWEKFFLYLDLEAIISRDPVRKRRWTAESEEGRQRMLSRYREELQQEIVDGDITLIPFEYGIERTSYNALEGTVTVLEKFRTGNYTEVKRYTYYLQRRNGVWIVVDYVVTNLGTE